MNTQNVQLIFKFYTMDLYVKIYFLDKNFLITENCLS